MTESDGVVGPTPMSDDQKPIGLRGVARRALDSCGGVTGIAVASTPTLAFVVANAVGGLTAALITLGVVAVTAFGVRLARRESLAGAVVGLAIAAVCAVVAAITGEARAFFLVPTLLPIGILLVCLGSVLIRRPLTGVLLNRLVGGPNDWRSHSGLMRVYTVTTLVAVVINILNFAVQAVFYLADQPAVLAAAHVATGPIFASLVAATLVAGRRALVPASAVRTI
jgi:hypothetical protein